MLCPADIIPANPIQNGTTSNEWYGITSYGGNAGSQSHPFSAVTSDGIFFYTGPAAPTFYQVRISNVTDGLSNTLFFGERNHFDPNYDTFAAPGWTFFSQTMGMWGWWASSSGGYGLSDVAESTYSPINYKVPIGYGSPNVGLEPEYFHGDLRGPAGLRLRQPAPGRGELRDGQRLGAVPQGFDRPDGLPRPGDAGRRRGDLGRLLLSQSLIFIDEHLGGLDDGLDVIARLKLSASAEPRVIAETISTPATSMTTSAITLPSLTDLTVAGSWLRALSIAVFPFRWFPATLGVPSDPGGQTAS